MHGNAGILFRSALELQRGVSTLNPASEQAQRECLASVVFAAMSAELAAEAEILSEPGWVKALGEIIGASEASHAPVESKYHLASLVLTGHVFDKGVQPFQDFRLLVDLRNLVVHTKPEEAIRQKQADGQWTWATKVMIRLAQRGAATAEDHILARFTPRTESATVHSNLLAEVSTHSVAELACRAAAGVVNAVLDAMPDDSQWFTPRMLRMYRGDFQVPSN